MKYEFNGRTLNIPDEEIEKSTKILGLSQEEAITLWLEDNEYEINEEQEALSKKARVNGVTAASCVKTRAAAPKSQRERVRKDDPTKEGIIAALAAFLPDVNATDIQVVNIGKLITFKVGEDTYKLDLVRQRKK